MTKTHEVYQSVPGILRPFKAYVQEAGLSDGDQIVYYGCPGTCTPFIELLGFVIRDIPVEQVFVPLLDETKARKMKQVPDVGMQVSNEAAVPDPDMVVLMGGLSMPNVPVTAEEAADLIRKYDPDLAGVCFMKMFEKAGWLDVLDFDLLIDANIDPVDVWK